jgi:hypothetical protein
MARQAAALRNIHERAPAGVFKQPALPHAGDEQVWKPIVVEISGGHAHAVHLHIQSGAAGDIGERAVAVIAIEPKRAAPAFVAGPVHPIDEQDVLPAIVIVIEKRAAGAQSFRQEFGAERAAIVMELNAGAGSRIHQPELRPAALGRHRSASQQKLSAAEAAHGSVTRPLRMAYTTNSAVRWIFSASIRLARCTDTVLTLN